jgi:hypothetical protein
VLGLSPQKSLGSWYNSFWPCGTFGEYFARLPLGVASEWTTDSGTEMHLIEATPDETTMVPGYEEHIFECSGCHHHVRRLLFTREIGPLTDERMRLPPAGRKTQNKGVAAKGAWRAVPPVKTLFVFAMLIMIASAGAMMTWDQGPKGPMGDKGPLGPKGPRGDPGPSSPASGIRIVRSNCDETTCAVQCSENEMLLTAYCGPKRNPAIIPAERTTACRNPANSPLVAVCAQMVSP